MRCIFHIFNFPSVRCFFFVLNGDDDKYTFRVECGLPSFEVYFLSFKGGYNTAYCVGVHSLYMTRAHRKRTPEQTGRHWNEVCARLSRWMFQSRQFSRVWAIDGEGCACCGTLCSNYEITKYFYVDFYFVRPFAAYSTPLKSNPSLYFRLISSFFHFCVGDSIDTHSYVLDVGCDKLRCDVIRNTIFFLVGYFRSLLLSLSIFLSSTEPSMPVFQHWDFLECALRPHMHCHVVLVNMWIDMNCESGFLSLLFILLLMMGWWHFIFSDV